MAQTTLLVTIATICHCISIASSADIDVDHELNAFEVAPIDREPCVQNSECDDWCKDQGLRNPGACVCRCEKWIPEADFSCKNGTTFCQVPPPPFWGGSFNLTADSFKSVCKKHEYILLAITAASCLHCVDFEPVYRLATPMLNKLGVPLARIDADAWKATAANPSSSAAAVRAAEDLLDQLDVTSLPVIKTLRKCRHLGPYKGVHAPGALRDYAEKLRAPAVLALSSPDQVLSFSARYNVSVVGFFERADDDKEELGDFEEAAEALRAVHNVHFAAVKSAKVAKAFRTTHRWFSQSPSVVVTRNFDADDQDRDVAVLSEFADRRLQDWITARSVRLVDELTGHNFLYYEGLKLPMLLLFVDKAADNAALLKAFRSVARGYQSRVSFAYLDGHQHAMRRLQLGLTDDRLPSMAFNTLDNRLYPFPSRRAITEASVKAFTEDFLAGRLKPYTPSLSKEEARRVEEKAAQDGAAGMVEATFDTFDEVAMDTAKDVLVLFYNSASPMAKDIWPYFRKLVERFRALGIHSLRIARFDVSKNQLPNRLEIETLPAIVMYPANDKEPPFKLFHGRARVRPIMLWAQEMASIKFEFPNDTPHLDDEQRKAYLVQIKERDEAVGKKRAEEREERRRRLEKEEAEGGRQRRGKPAAAAEPKQDL